MTRRASRFSRRQFILFAAVLLAIESARADETGGPIVVNPHQNLTPVHIDMPTGNIMTNYIYENDTDAQKGGPKTETTENSFQESVDAATKGYIFNSNFIQFGAGGQFGLEQDSYSGTNGHQNGNGTIEGWNLAATAFPASSTPINAYTRQNQDYFTPAFSPTLKNTDTGYGSGLRLQNSFAPTQFTFDHDDNKQTEAGGFVDYELHRDTAAIHTDFVNLANQILTFDYSYQNTRSREDDSFAENYQTNDISVSHRINFGSDLRDSLTSSFTDTDQTGFLNYSDAHLNEYLRLQNTPTLETHYQYTFDRTDVNGLTQTSHRGDIGFVHHLYQSLLTTGDLGAQLFDNDGGDQTDLFGRLNFAYRKHVPDGLLLSNVNFGWQSQHQSSGNNIVSFVNQPETFVNDAPITLPQQNINAQSVVVFTDGAPYVLGKDYAISHLGKLTQIQRLPGGRIPFAGSVLIDYNLLPQPSSTINTTDFGASLRYEIDHGFLAGLSPYVRYDRQDQSIATQETGFITPETYNDLVVGADYHIWHVTFNAEQQWHESSLVPYDAYRLSARYVQQAGLNTTLTLNANFQNINYYDENDLAQD
ncbi:MAG TPA: hypothetical protein VG722_13810, partial [Tepidisphaeraceae bacterium]|nr:hypothetical protein [Tepidisphaeraceae bacterium]